MNSSNTLPSMQAQTVQPSIRQNTGTPANTLLDALLMTASIKRTPPKEAQKAFILATVLDINARLPAELVLQVGSNLSSISPCIEKVAIDRMSKVGQESVAKQLMAPFPSLKKPASSTSLEYIKRLEHKLSGMPANLTGRADLLVAAVVTNKIPICLASLINAATQTDFLRFYRPQSHYFNFAASAHTSISLPLGPCLISGQDAACFFGPAAQALNAKEMTGTLRLSGEATQVKERSPGQFRFEGWRHYELCLELENPQGKQVQLRRPWRQFTFFVDFTPSAFVAAQNFERAQQKNWAARAQFAECGPDNGNKHAWSLYRSGSIEGKSPSFSELLLPKCDVRLGR